MPYRSNINIQVELDEEKVPATIEWSAPDGGVPDMQPAKAILLGLWDGEEKTALRIDLWTAKMMVDEMNDFFYQSLFQMADTYQRATKNAALAQELRDFAKGFHDKATKALEEENKQ